MINFFLHCIPPKKTHQSSMRIFKTKDGRTFLGHDKKGMETQNNLLSMLMQYQPEKPLEGALKLEVKWVYPWRTSEPKKNRAKGYLPCLTKPDCDNLAKQLQDCMTKLCFWIDDAQVYSLSFEKYYGDDVGIDITIKTEND